jgi:cation:H+ antiporter
MTTAIFSMIGGLAALVVGGELLVRGASRIAALAGISPLVIGLTVVAFGTSSPELAVSVKACLGGQTDIAVGNVVGSNIFNVLFILGVSALVTPLVVSRQLIRVDVPIMIVVSVALLVLGLDGGIGRLEGIGLFIGVICYTGWAIRQSRKESAASQRGLEQELPGTPKKKSLQSMVQVGLILGGLVLLTLGAKWLVDGSVAIATLLGMSELLIGLTIIAAGTSLPEVAASILASIKGERDIAVGNVVGSNIFNIMCVLGFSAAVSPDGVEVSQTALRFDIPVMIAVALACLPIFFTGHVIARWEGGLFLAYYCMYTAYLILAATNESVSQTLGSVMLGFVVPLTVITLLVGVARSLKSASPDDS